MPIPGVGLLDHIADAISRIVHALTGGSDSAATAGATAAAAGGTATTGGVALAAGGTAAVATVTTVGSSVTALGLVAGAGGVVAAAAVSAAVVVGAATLPATPVQIAPILDARAATSAVAVTDSDLFAGDHLIVSVPAARPVKLPAKTGLVAVVTVPASAGVSDVPLGETPTPVAPVAFVGTSPSASPAMPPAEPAITAPAAATTSASTAAEPAADAPGTEPVVGSETTELAAARGAAEKG